MKNTTIYIIVAISTLMVVFIISSPQFKRKAGALGSVGQTLINADCNYIPVVECGGIAMQAEFNLQVITQAAEYLEAVGGNTQVFLTIARIASETQEECPRLASLLDLAVMKTSESMTIIALAESACRIETPEHEEAWQSVYHTMLESAEYSSVAEALSDAVDH